MFRLHMSVLMEAGGVPIYQDEPSFEWKLWTSHMKREAQL